MRKGYAMTSDKKRFNSIQAVADELGVSESIAWSDGTTQDVRPTGEQGHRSPIRDP